MLGERLLRPFFAAPAEMLARRLLGQILVRILDSGERLSGRIVETEAYLGVIDRAAHSFGGRRTARVLPMYGPGGTAYVYFTYGMHHCFNVAAGREGDPVAVLIRALEPLEGTESMERHRMEDSASKRRVRLELRELCSGPGRLCSAMRIDRRQSGLDLTGSPELWIERGRGPRSSVRVRSGPRVGLGDVGEWTHRQLRYWIEGSTCVSRP